ncbi:MAG: CNP1-like family protein [Pseudomonadota bacterium]|nr:CNP1-like family protein [Pseudomonadota bacterium]
MKKYQLIAVVSLSLLPLISFAQRPINPRPGVMPEQADKPEWVEESIAPPDYPRDEDLIPVEMAASSNRFFVDGKTLSLGADGVMRYTMVIRSTGGALNVTYEGIRCDTREKKLYALGRKDRTWGAARSSKWTAVTESGTRTYQTALMKDFFCPQEASVKTTEEAIDALRAGFHPKVQSRAKR